MQGHTPHQLNWIHKIVTIVLIDSGGCTHGEVRRPLLGGASEDEGVVEVCVNGIYLPVSLDNGNFSTREASIICRQLSPQANKGMISSYPIAIRLYVAMWYTCIGKLNHQYNSLSRDLR